MRSEKIRLGHKHFLYQRLKDIDIPISEYSFANIYLFRNRHVYEVIFNKHIFIKGKTYDGLSYLMPTIDIGQIEAPHLKSLISSVDFLFPVPKEWLDFLDKKTFKSSYKQEDIDYIYTVDKISTYRGSKLHKKRNLLKQFLTLYKCQAYPLTNDRLPDAENILSQWQADVDDKPEETDYYPCLEALRLYDELVLCGVIYYVENEAAGFIIGEELNPEVFTIHFAKGKIKFKGIYQYMYNTFAKILPSKYKYLNLQQDLGKYGLRMAKSSYVPDVMLKKYRISMI